MSGMQGPSPTAMNTVTQLVFGTVSLSLLLVCFPLLATVVGDYVALNTSSFLPICYLQGMTIIKG